MPPNASGKIVINALTDDMANWFVTIGGSIITDNYKSRKVQYLKGKPSYNMQDGTGNTLLHFHQDDVIIASTFLLMYAENVISHNITQEHLNEY